MPNEQNEGPNYGLIAWKYFKSFLIILHGLFDCVVDFFFGLYYNDTTRKYIPPVDHSFLLESAMSIARKIRNGEVNFSIFMFKLFLWSQHYFPQLTSVDVVNAYIARIAQVNGILNSVVDERYKDAIEEAKEADRMIQSGDWSKERLEKERPFHGVPISNKESTCVKGN